jgi:hypothetical protein
VLSWNPGAGPLVGPRDGWEGGRRGRTPLQHALKRACPSAITDGASDGELRVDPVHAEGERDLAAMVQVVFEHMPDHPGARQLDWRAIPVVGKGLVHVGGIPARQTIRHELPGAVEALGQLGGGWDGHPQRPRNLVPTRIHLHLLAAVFAQEIDEPVGTAADDVQGIFADGAQVRYGAQLKLLGGERRERQYCELKARFNLGASNLTV